MTVHRTTVLASRRRTLWLAAILHRLSGIGLALFLPLHFLVLGLAINGESKLDTFLRWTNTPSVKLAEGALLFLLTIHFLGGVRLLVIENFAWRDAQKQMVFAAVGVSAVAMFVFLARAL